MDAAALRKSRAGHRAVATRRIKEVGDAVAEPDVIKLEQWKRGLKDTFDTLKRLDEALMPHIDPGDVNTEIEESERINDEIFTAMALVERALV